MADLEELLQLFENEITLADINSSEYLGKISAAIVKKRIDLQMTQKNFANYLGVSQGMVSRWEGGDYNFTVKGIAEIAEKLDMELYINLKENKTKTKTSYLGKPEFFIGGKSKVIQFHSKAGSVYHDKQDISKIYSFNETIEM